MISANHIEFLKSKQLLNSLDIDLDELKTQLEQEREINDSGEDKEATSVLANFR